MIFFCKAKKTVRDSRLRGNGILDIFTLRRLRGGVRARSGRGGWRVADDCRRSSTPQKFAGANFYPPPQAAEGETHFHSREGGNLPIHWGEQRSHRIVFLQLEVGEIPAFAGMEGGGMKEKATAKLTNLSIPAKAGISAAKPHSPTGDHCNVPLRGKFSLSRE